MLSRDERDAAASAAAAFVVDDDGDTARALAAYLTKSGVETSPVADGWTALRLIAEGARPRVVVSDLRMPELDGMEFAARLRALDAALRPEIIFLSGAAGFDDAVAAIRLGAADMLQKPVAPARLVYAVKDAMLRSSARSPNAEAAEPTGDHVSKSAAEEKRALLNELRTVRRLRARHFAPSLFSDPNWEMLLDLYDAALAGKAVTITSLGAASGLPLSTALRRMEELQAHGLIEKKADSTDRRRILVCLTDKGIGAIERFFDSYAALPRAPHPEHRGNVR